MEYTKFAKRREPYRKALAAFRNMGFTDDDYIHHNASFAGHMNLARFLALYEMYKQTLGLSGHIAEIGVWKASCLLYFAKLTQLFEPESLTLVHGFDWFKGTEFDSCDKTVNSQALWTEDIRRAEDNRSRTDDEASEMYERISTLIAIQDLDHLVHLHRLDVRQDLGAFFEKWPHMQFKIVFLDAGTYGVVSACLAHFWPRLVGGGVLILDHFNQEIAPGETRAVREYLGDVPVQSFVFTGRPSAYIVKPDK